MKVKIEFFRSRAADDAHALLGREIVEVPNYDQAVEAAHELSRSLSMPQQPDAFAIYNADGVRIHLERLP